MSILVICFHFYHGVEVLFPVGGEIELQLRFGNFLMSQVVDFLELNSYLILFVVLGWHLVKSFRLISYGLSFYWPSFIYQVKMSILMVQYFARLLLMFLHDSDDFRKFPFLNQLSNHFPLYHRIYFWIFLLNAEGWRILVYF